MITTPIVDGDRNHLYHDTENDAKNHNHSCDFIGPISGDGIVHDSFFFLDEVGTSGNTV